MRTFEGQTLTEQQVTQKLKSIDYNLFRDIARKVIETSFTENFIVGIVSPYNLIKAISATAKYNLSQVSFANSKRAAVFFAKRYCPL